jgi:hypothetical protein
MNEQIEEILRNPAVLKAADSEDYTDEAPAKWAWFAHGYDTGMVPFYSIEQLREAVRSVCAIAPPASLVQGTEATAGGGANYPTPEKNPTLTHRPVGVIEAPEARRERLIANGYKTDSRCTWLAIGRCADCGRIHDGKPLGVETCAETSNKPVNGS